MGLGRLDEAIDDIITSIEIDGDNRVLYSFKVLIDSAFTQLVAKLKVQLVRDISSDYWSYVLGAIYEMKKDYRTALDYFNISLINSVLSMTYYKIAFCYIELGDFKSALENIEFVINIEPEE